MLKTKSGLPKHCSWNTDRHGTRRVRFRKDGFSTYLAGTPWSEDFMHQYAAGLDGVKAQRGEIGATRTKPGSLDALIVSYYRSPEFRGLKATTQVVRRNMLERFRATRAPSGEPFGAKPLKGLARRHISDIIGAKADTPEAANNLLKVLRVLLDYAVGQDMMEANPARGVKRYQNRSDGHHVWTDDEVAEFFKRHPIDTRAGQALALLYFTAQRRGDVIRMGRQHLGVDDKGRPVMHVRQEKTGAALVVPLHPTLNAMLISLPASNMTFMVTEKGAPFTAAGFGNWFRDRCDEAGLPHCSAHGLRKSMLTKLANNGATHEQLKAFSGHLSDSALAPYLKTADQQRNARGALDALLRVEGEQTLSSLPTRLDKTAAK